MLDLTKSAVSYGEFANYYLHFCMRFYKMGEFSITMKQWPPDHRKPYGMCHMKHNIIGSFTYHYITLYLTSLKIHSTLP